MVKLTIAKIGEYNEYVLMNGSREFLFALTFYNMPNPKVGDILFFPKSYLNINSPDFVHSLYFEPLDNKELQENSKTDLAGLYTKNKNYILKRIYG